MAKIATKSVKAAEKKAKDKYQLTNWSDYNQSLVKRGSLTLWIDEPIIEQWIYEGSHQRGGKLIYSDKCIECLLQLKVVFDLPYRQLQGLSESLLQLMQIDLEVPSYTQICRRSKNIEIDIEAPKSKGPLFLVVDSTGLKVYGEGEWKVRKHGYNKRRTWRKLHLGVDESTGIIYAQILTGNGKGDGDAQQVDELLDQVESPIDRFSGDGAYDTFDTWETLVGRGIQGIIPPQENAIYWVDEKDNLMDHPRNHILEQIELKGRKKWKEESNYHRRSLSETAMYRFKKTYGAELYSRKMESQKTEAAVKIKCLNKMTGTGMPISKKVAA